MPFDENEHFVGRRDELAKLEQKFFGQPCGKRAAIVGLGGIGKTQVVLSFAYSVWKTRPDFSVFWVPAVSAETIEKAFEEIAERLGLPAPLDDETGHIPVVRRYLASPTAGRWQLIIDNADDSSIVEGDAQTRGLLRQLPRSDRGLTLLTTRTKAIAQAFAGGDTVVVGKPSEEDATMMLREAVADEASLDNQAAVSDLLVELDNHPLAIAQAAAYMNVHSTFASDYLNLLRSREQDVVEIMSTQIADKTRYGRSENAIARTWIVSFQQIVDRDEHAAKLLRFISCIEWKAIPESILPAIDSKARMTKAIGLLCSYSFLSRRRSEKMYDMHRLVHLATRVWDGRYGYPDGTRQEVVLHLSGIFPHGEHEQREVWRAYLPHVARISKDAAGMKLDGKGQLYKFVGHCLRVDGRIKEAVSWLEESSECFQDFAEDDTDRLSTQHVLAIAYKANGQVKEAVKLLEHVVAVHKEVLAEDHPSRLASQHELAAAYRANGQVKEAVELLEHVVAVHKEVLAENHPSRLASQHELAAAYWADGQRQRGLQLLKYVVSIDQKELKGNHPSRLKSEGMLARWYNEDDEA